MEHNYEMYAILDIEKNTILQNLIGLELIFNKTIAKNASYWCNNESMKTKVIKVKVSIEEVE